VVAGLDVQPCPPQLLEHEGFLGVEVDITDPVAVQSAARHVAISVGPCTVLVNCAGVLAEGGVLDTTLDAWERVMAVNLRGTWLVCRAILPQLVESGGGVVVTVASGTGLRPIEGLAAYSASKAALVSLCRSMAIEHKSDGIRSVCVCPGPVDTPMGRAGAGAGDAAFGAGRDSRPLIDPDEIASTIAFLCSPASPSLTGAVLAIDGGRTLH
jgi:NAD(P)-dependent dehydrogenase (short-subunit alcohol dehydrogenase family)